MTEPAAARDFALRDPRGPFLRRWIAGSIDLVFAAFTVLLANRLIPVSLHEEHPFLGAAVALVLIVVYFWLPEALWGATLGKLFVKVRVVDAAGQPPGLGRALVRTVLRFLEVNPFLFGAIPAALVAYRSKAGQRLGDLLAKTYVLRCSDLASLAAREGGGGDSEVSGVGRLGS